jgi:hypothetical protein
MIQSKKREENSSNMETWAKCQQLEKVINCTDVDKTVKQQKRLLTGKLQNRR